MILGCLFVVRDCQQSVHLDSEMNLIDRRSHISGFVSLMYRSTHFQAQHSTAAWPPLVHLQRARWFCPN